VTRRWQPLEAVVPAGTVLSESDAPTFAAVHAVLALVPEEQTMYYEANPATNKKVSTCSSQGSKLVCFHPLHEYR
jgi:hypothetical protein